MVKKYIKKYEEAFKAYAKIRIYILKYKDKEIASFYTKEETIEMRNFLHKTPLYYYGTIEDVQMEEHIKIIKGIGYIETEIDYKKIEKSIKGKIEKID